MCNYSKIIYNNIHDIGRVSTIAGDAAQGYEDGDGTESTFFTPSGVAVTSDNIAYIIDSGSCRMRRIKPMHKVAMPL